MGLAADSMKRGKAVAGCLGEICKGFRDFLLRGNVVDMAVGIVVGSAFTALVNAFVSDFITPLIGAIWGGGNFNDLTFSINGSLFYYGHFINTFLTFLIVCLVVYFAVVVPMNKLLKKVHPAYFQQKRPGGCPFCCDADVPYKATRCKHCCAELPPLAAAELAELESEENEGDELVTGPPKGAKVAKDQAV
ncbi:hypothetical protein ABPG75_005008 [Micractinium tetrahymenae]